MLILYLIVCLGITAVSSVSAQSNTSYISPGIKLGYVMDGGFFVGVEVSYAYWDVDQSIMSGLVAGFDLLDSKTWRINAGIQVGSGLGLTLGPAYQKSTDSAGEFGLMGSAFLGAYAMPYYAYTWKIQGGYREVGILGKLPLLLSGAPYTWRPFSNSYRF